MATVQYREAQQCDIPAMAEIRAGDWGTQEQWSKTIGQYIDHQHHPREALFPRICFVCDEGNHVVGLIAGHLSRRFDCDGELQWISVRPNIAHEGLRSDYFAAWLSGSSLKVRDVSVLTSTLGTKTLAVSTTGNGAENLRPRWMVWDDIGTALRARP